MLKARPGPQLLRRIVFGYTVDCFPSQLILGHNRLKRMLERAGYNINVSMCPLDDIPLGADIVFVPKQLEEQAHRTAAHGQVRACEDFVNQPMYDDLIKLLGEGRKWTAPLIVQDSQDDSTGKIKRYRGYEQIE
jgi:mannitol-specific phosphotransferase system IIBC component